MVTQGFPGGSVGKESTCNAGATGDAGLIPGWGRSPGEGNGNPTQYSCLGNSMDRGAWRATVHGVAKNWTRLSTTLVCSLLKLTAYFSSKIAEYSYLYIINLEFLMCMVCGFENVCPRR